VADDYALMLVAALFPVLPGYVCYCSDDEVTSLSDVAVLAAFVALLEDCFG